MGCNSICKAKKKAKKAKKQAAEEERKADASIAAAKKQAAAAKATSGALAGKSKTYSVKSYSVETITVAKYLGIDNQKNALSIREMERLLKTARRSPTIVANSVAKSLIKPVSKAIGVYKYLDYGRKAFLIAKPAVKVASQINDIAVCNFMAIGELIADIAQLVLQVLIGFAPYLIELLKNILLNIPLYTKVITNEQSIVITNLIVTTKVNIENVTKEVLVNFEVSKQRCPDVLDALAAIRAVEGSINSSIQSYTQGNPIPVLEDLADVVALRDIIIEYIIAGLGCGKKTVVQDIIAEVNKEEMDVLSIPDMANADVEDKQAMKAMLDGMLEMNKKVAVAETEELLRRQFAVSQSIPTADNERFADFGLAEAAADNVIQALRNMLVFNLTAYNKTDGSVFPKLDIEAASELELNREISKKVNNVAGSIEDITTIAVVEELIQSNKIQILQNVIYSIDNVGFDTTKVVLDDCVSFNINSDFGLLRVSTKEANAIAVAAEVIDSTSEMIAFKDQIYADTKQMIIDELIEVRDTCGFAEQLCNMLHWFKSELSLNIKKNLDETSLNIAAADVPDYIDPLKLTEMVKLFNGEINKEIADAAKTIIHESIIPCKACKPCEQIKDELYFIATGKIEKIKDEMIRNAGVFIDNDGLDWTITQDGTKAQSIIDKKAQLTEAYVTAIDTKAGSVNLIDEFIIRLKAEEADLVASIKVIIKNL